jgi:hypothetical protein
MPITPSAGFFALLPLLVLGLVLYVAWNILQTLRSIDRSVAEVAKNLRNQ